MVKAKSKTKSKTKSKADKVFIQCGYEDLCKHKDCMECPRKKKYNLTLTLAEEIAVEDFAVCDLDAMINGGIISKGFSFPAKKKEVDLMQDVMRKLMYKIFKQQKD